MKTSLWLVEMKGWRKLVCR